MSPIKYILIITFTLLLTACESKDDTVIEQPVRITENVGIISGIPADDAPSDDILSDDNVIEDAAPEKHSKASDCRRKIVFAV